jgi:hypothetical protein
MLQLRGFTVNENNLNWGYDISDGPALWPVMFQRCGLCAVRRSFASRQFAVLPLTAPYSVYSNKMVIGGCDGLFQSPIPVQRNPIGGLPAAEDDDVNVLSVSRGSSFAHRTSPCQSA